MNLSTVRHTAQYVLVSVIFSGCSQHISGMVPEARAGVSGIDIRVPIPAGRGINYSKRYVDSHGVSYPGKKIWGSNRTYWFPPEARVTTYQRQILVVGFHALFVFPRNVISARNNETDSEIDFGTLAPETNEAIVAYIRDPRTHKAGATGRSKRIVNAGGGSCDAMDPSCICPDCSWEPETGWSPDLAATWGWNATTAGNAALSCALAGYADDPDLLLQCLAGAGLSGPRDLLYSAVRQNARDYVWYAATLDTVLSTQTNPLRSGATAYSITYNSLFDGPLLAQGSFIGTSAFDDFINVHQFPTKSFGFSQTRITYYGPGGPIGGSLARLARISTGSSGV